LISRGDPNKALEAMKKAAQNRLFDNAE